MKKSDYKGWKDVFCFSFMQGVKEKSYIIFLIIMAVAMLVGPLFLNLFGGDEEKEIDITVEKLVIYDEVGLPIDYKKAFAGSNCENVVVEVVSEATEDSFDEYIQKYEENKALKEMALQISFEESGYFDLKFVMSANGDLTEEECEEVVVAFDAFFTEEKLRAIDVTEEQLIFINQVVENEVVFTDAEGNLLAEEEKSEGISMEEYYVLLGGIMICMMLITLSGSSIANSIVTEKSTKVVEYLMINVRPMALIVGKILSSLLLTVIQFAVIGVCYLLSNVLQSVVLGAENVKSLSETLSIFALFAGVSPINIVMAILIIFMGILFFSILAGLAGASVSKMDELAEGMKIYQLCMVVGAYIGIGICIMEMIGGVDPMVINICSMIPISTPFIVPVTLLMGRSTTLIAVIGFCLLTIITILLYLFTANVYESMIFYNGKVLKFKDILQIAKVRRKEGK